MKALIVFLATLYITDVTAGNDFFRPSGGHHSEQVQIACRFDMGGVSGTIHLLQRHRISAHTKLHIKLNGLKDLPGNNEYGLYITDYPVNLNLVNPCAPAVVGGTYNPEGIDTTLPTYSTRCRANHKQCAIGDLVTRHNNLTGNDSGVLVEYRDFNLNLYGPNTVVGRGMILRRSDNGDTLSCCNIESPTNTRVLRAQFVDQVFSGQITIEQPQYDYVDYTINENTIIMVDLERIDGGRATVPNLEWQLQRGFADKTCSHLDPMLGQKSIMIAGGQRATCSQTQHRTCRLGDLTTKCGPLQLVNNRIRAQCTDNQLGLVSFSTLNRLVVSITGPHGRPILDCAQLTEQIPTGAYVNFRFNGLFVNLMFSQPSPFRPTYYQTYVLGLHRQARNIIVYDGGNPDLKNCSNLGNVLDYHGRLPVANPNTSDQYPAGVLGPKMGGVRGKNYLRNHGLSSNIPLIGPVNIIDKPIAVLHEDGFIWGCGLVEIYNNPPHQTPTNIFDYLDIWRPPNP